MRHGERVDLTYGHWVEHCFDSGTYSRKDLNLPLKLADRAGGADSYYKDTPLTRVGQFQAQLVGEALRLAGITVRHVYASAALRCVETANYFLQDLMAIALQRVEADDRTPHSYQISKNLLKVPYCALGAMRDKPFELVCPPCPPSINSSSGRFDWRILKDLH
ncbi:Ecdysteroid-phosphate phosphatase, partial [Operophtera brumata]